MSEKIPNPIWTESNGMVSVIGSYKQNVDGQVHAIIKNLPGNGGASYRTLCETYVGLHFISSDGSFIQNGRNLYIHSLPFRNVTCKRCLRIISNSKQSDRPVYRPKVADHLGRPAELIGTHHDWRSQAIHAMISTNDTIRTICGTAFPNNTYPYKPWPNTTKGLHEMVFSITCQDCLKALESNGIIPDKPAKKKFFLVFYNGDTVENIYDFDELLQDAQRFKPTINKILLIDSYRTVSMKTSLVDEDGNEITKDDL